jgi:hypothetical protein
MKLSADADVSARLHIGEGLETCSGHAGRFSADMGGRVCGCNRSLPHSFQHHNSLDFGEVNDGGANARAAQACAIRWQTQTRTFL